MDFDLGMCVSIVRPCVWHNLSLSDLNFEGPELELEIEQDDGA